MLLNDIGKSPDATFRKINQHLETNYGFKIAEDTSDRDLVAIMEQIEEEITDLKIKGNDAKASPEISKRLLVLEGIKTLREFAILQFQSPDLENVVGGMCDFVCNHFKLGGMHHADFEESVKDAMKHYRSSKYRFPDDIIEQRVRQGAMSKIQALSNSTPTAADGVSIDMESMFEGDGDNNGIEDAQMKGIDVTEQDTDVWASEPWRKRPRDASFGGGVNHHSGGVAPDLNTPPKDAEDPIPMIRDKHGRIVPNPFAAQKAARKKGIVGETMKENLVKNLRRLLETEVSQAEVMMAAKKFAEELQEMIEKIGRLQNENLPPVTDQMRETYGTDSSSAFQTQIYGALQGVMDSLYTAKTQVDDAVSNMAATGQVSAQTDMDVPVDGMGDGMDVDAGMDADLDNIAGDLDAEDEFGAEDGEEPLGRAMKESVLQRKVVEMRKLVEKAKKLREATVRENTALTPETNMSEYYDQTGDQTSIIRYIRQLAKLPNDAPVYFDDADLVYGDKTIIGRAIYNSNATIQDAVRAVLRASVQLREANRIVEITEARQPIANVSWRKYNNGIDFFSLFSGNDFDRERTYEHNGDQFWVGEVQGEDGNFDVHAQFVFKVPNDESQGGMGRFL